MYSTVYIYSKLTCTYIMFCELSGQEITVSAINQPSSSGVTSKPDIISDSKNSDVSTSNLFIDYSNLFFLNSYIRFQRFFYRGRRGDSLPWPEFFPLETAVAIIGPS